MKSSKQEKEIIALWDNGMHLDKILSKGYNCNTVMEVLDKYTKKNARKWLKER